jgi:uncharacterized YccA/Bax inhibitor family protein
MENSGAIKGVCALAGILIFVGMGKLLEGGAPSQAVWGIGGFGLAVCFIIYRLAGSKD